MVTEYEQEAKTDHEKQEARLKVHTTVKKVVPGPGVLGQGHGNQLKSSEHQEKSADDFSTVGGQCRYVVMGPIHERSMIHEFPASFVDSTLSDELSRV
jgi:hypothetical protein